ncbi:MAG: choice-of-anchor E domain-containing protein [Chitinophagaceae bacterium]
MKNIYTKTFFLLFTIALQLYLPAGLQAQCLCALGVPATPQKQVITIPPTTISTLNFTFQQFDPSIGTLNCIKVEDTITGISYTGALNTGPDSTAFLFLLSLTSKISGPGVNIVQPFSKTYGYDTLSAYGTPGDTITYGPQNIIPNPTGGANTGGNAAYIGMGTVNFTYAINGGMITQDGGSNYKSAVSTTIGGTIGLTYYYCPSSLLAGNMRNFSAVKRDNSIMLKWEAQNTPETDQFDIEYSIDGNAFTAVAQVAAGRGAAATTYNYKYPLNGNSSGAVYFRIKQTGNNDQPVYSAVQKIMLNEKTAAGFSIYPNPVTNGMAITFEQPLSGDYSVDLVNLSGQVVVNKKVKLINSNNIPVSWTSKPAPGIYFTRITNTSSMEQQIVRVVIQ